MIIINRFMTEKIPDIKVKAIMHSLKLAAFLFLLFFMYGCSAPTYYVRPKTNMDITKKIAVLPFESLTTDINAGEKIRRSVMTELMSRGVEVTEPGEVTRVLNELKLKFFSAIKVSDMQSMAKTLGVESVMTGSVDAFGISKGVVVQYAEVSINLKLYDANTGLSVWTVRHSSGGPSFWTRHFGAEGMSLTEAAVKVVREALDTLFKYDKGSLENKGDKESP